MTPSKQTNKSQLMIEGGRRLSRVMAQVLKLAKPGVSLQEIDQLAESLINKSNSKPSFKTVKNYSWATCLNVNQGVVHGVPNDSVLRERDLLSVDMGLFFQGFHTDMARTIKVKSKKRKAESEKFLQVGKKALRKAIKMANPGNRIGHLSQAMEAEIKGAGYFPVKSLTGHGIGRQLHQEPSIPCLLKEEISLTPQIKIGMALAVEVIYTRKKTELILRDDGWTIETEDNDWAGLFEDTILVTPKGPIVLTK
ncbi:type I methionyl aminopeptidase [Patescibacteria group bacterium]